MLLRWHVRKTLLRRRTIMRSRTHPICCFILSIVLVPAWALAVDPVGHWTFNGDLSDAVGAAEGIFNGGTPAFVTGKAGQALAFDGADDYVDVMVGNIDAYTISAWVKPTRLGAASLVARTSSSGTTTHWSHQIRITVDNLFEHYLWDGSARSVIGTTAVEVDTWYHVAITAFNNGDVRLYVNGQEEGTADTVAAMWADGDRYAIGSNSGGGIGWFEGLIDDVRIYDTVLPQEEIMPVLSIAAEPDPADLMTDVLRDSVLGWTASEFAVTHDVYFGTAFADVNDATTPVSQGQEANTFDPGLLAFGQTYYWRVDEVNGAPDRTIFKGDVWSFTAEPFSIPVDMITATASSSQAANMGPENTINGIGLNALDEHSTEGTDMWLSGMGDATPSIQYEFDKAYKLDEMWVWNSNQLIEAFVGLGAKDVVVETSTDGIEWTTLEGATQFAQATGSPTYTANTIVDFGGTVAKFVKITVNAGYGMLPQYGISAVRILYIPTLAREPQPAHEASSDTANVVLSWRAGREAASHQVYLGTNAGNLSMLGTTDESSYDAGALDYDTTYYWQIIEVNEAEIPTSHAGTIWSFATPAFATVDSFDTYDDNCNRIFFAWADGLGHNGGEDIDDCDMAPSNGNGGGSIVGNASAPFAEKTIVYAGPQSMPLEYDNAFGASEATLSLGSQDWTASGITSLSLQVFGTADNTGQLYIKINNTKVDGAPDISQAGWQPWIIDLSTVGGNLQSVTSLSIGVDGANAAGMVYIDSIGLYPQAAEFITPQEPDGASLLVHYSFDGDVLDSSGQGVDGEAIGAPAYGDGMDGQAIQLNGMDNYVNLVLDVPEDGATTAFWFKTSNPDCGLHTVVQDLLGGGGHDRHIYLIDGNVSVRIYNDETITAAGSQVADGQWHHVAHAFGADVGGQRLYIDGLLQASGTKAQSDFDWQERVHFGFSNDAANDYMEGMLDDARIYGRPLTAAEIAWLAGKREPMPKPF
jgi:hypothetical protein